MSRKLSPEHEHTARAPGTARCAVLTISSALSPETDYGGRTVAYLLAHHGHSVVRRWIIPDGEAQIDEAIADVLDDDDVDVLISTGGTGLSKREVTVEVFARRIAKRLDGFAEVLRYLLYKEMGPSAAAVRAVAGVTAGKVLIALPSAHQACELAMQHLVIPELGKLVEQARK